jgi:hypothetical protein
LPGFFSRRGWAKNNRFFGAFYINTECLPLLGLSSEILPFVNQKYLAVVAISILIKLLKNKRKRKG